VCGTGASSPEIRPRSRCRAPEPSSLDSRRPFAVLGRASAERTRLRLGAQRSCPSPVLKGWPAAQWQGGGALGGCTCEVDDRDHRRISLTVPAEPTPATRTRPSRSGDTRARQRDGRRRIHPARGHEARSGFKASSLTAWVSTAAPKGNHITTQEPGAEDD
jgi:hypothetical protein